MSEMLERIFGDVGIIQRADCTDEGDIIVRNILFKGYLIEDGGWITGEYHRYTSEIVVSMSNFAYSAFKVVPESVGSYIGAEDCHGNYIFEGDILEVHPMDDRESSIIGVVGFKDGHYGVEYDVDYSDEGKGFHRIEATPRYCCDKEPEMVAIYRYEVVGNVYENPELLKE